MKFENSCVVAVPCPRLWDYMVVIPNVAQCLPGVEKVDRIGEGKYAGVMAVKVGIVKMRLAGKISIELMDEEHRLAVLSVQAADERISGLIQGKLTMRLAEQSPEETRLSVETELNLFGRIGEFGGPIIKKKADQMMAEFARNVASGVAAAAKSASPTPP